MIIDSADVADYLYWKTVVAADEEVQELKKAFLKAKDFFSGMSAVRTVSSGFSCGEGQGQADSKRARQP